MKSSLSTIGPFDIRRQIATGTSSTVFEAIHRESSREVALKVFHPQLNEDPKLSERLQREAETLSRLRHPNIVQLIQAWTIDSHFFLELEKVDGSTLKDWIKESPPFWIEPHLYVLAQVARALGAVHEQQILHRDLKPENVLITHSGTVKLADFGLAKCEFFRSQLTQTGSAVGSLAYMAPEVLEGDQASFSSDIFSFGILAYEILAGRHPFLDDQGSLRTPDLLAGQFTPLIKANPKLPQEICFKIEGCLAKNPQERPSSIWLLEACLMDHLQKYRQIGQVQDWIKTQDEAIARQALADKNSLLKNEILLATRSGVDRSSVLSRINEFHSLFPHDSSWIDMMSAISSPSRSSRNRKRNVFFFVGILSFIALLTLPMVVKKSNFESTNETQDSKIQPPQSVLKEPTPPTTPSPSAPIKAKHISSGTLKLSVDSDVSVFVNGRRIAGSQYSGLKLNPGSYTVVLEKKGYLPIEQSVTVRSGQTTTINTKAEQK